MSEQELNNTLADIDASIQAARELRNDDRLEESQALLLELLQSYPDDPLVMFEVGGSYDVLGAEEEAIPYYQRAIDAGLQDPDLQECLVCLGSSLRVVGRADEAVKALEKAVASHPELPSGRVFLALAYLDDDRIDESVATLLDVILDIAQDEDLETYSSALEYYRDELFGTLEDE